MNPINGKKHTFDLKKLDGTIAKIRDMDSKIDNFIEMEDLKKLVKEIVAQEIKTGVTQNKFESEIVTTDMVHGLWIRSFLSASHLIFALIYRCLL